MRTFLGKTLPSLAICLFAFSGVGAQTGRFYSTENGLSSSLVNQLYQGSRGFIWCATEYGLSKFDGLHFSNYRHQPGQPTSLKNNYVRCLFEDERQNLLVGCIDGLMRYDRATDTFHEIPMTRAGKRVSPHVTQMLRLHHGEIWITTTGQGMFRLDEKKQQAVSADDRLKQDNYNFQSNLYEDSNRCLWIGTEGDGLIRYLPETGQTKVFKHPAINDNTISAILEDPRGDLFIGTQKQGLSRYDRNTERFLPVPCADGSTVSVYCLSVVDGQLLVGTDGQGLKKYNPSTGKLDNHVINSSPIDFSSGKIHSILEDKDHNLWIGLFQKGIVIIPKQENPFEYYGNKSIHYNPIGRGCVMSVFQDSNQHLWVGTDNEGLYELGTDGKRLQHIRPDGSPRSVGSTVMCIYEDSENNFWIGSYTRGIAKLNRQTGLCEYPLNIDNEKILSVTEDKRKNLYIATLGSGFYRYNLLTGELKHYESSRDEKGDLKRNELANDWVNYLFCDSEGLIWIAHYKGVSCFDPATGNFLPYQQTNTLINGCVGYAFLEDREGHIWAGTTGGLFRFDKRTGTIKKFTTQDGLPNNVICGICEDNNRNLWISTYMGLSRYDVRNNRFINYYAGDGLQDNEFMHGAFHRAASGKIYFGGINGITGFLPEAIGSTAKETDVWIIDFHVAGEQVHKHTLSGGRPIVFEAVQDADFFRLSHNDNTFSLTFSTLRYNNPEQIAYQYKIVELGDKWLSTEPGANRVTYNQLPPGKYTFQVRALYHGNFSKVRSVKILVSPPWYATWWAYCFYVALTALLMAGAVHYLRSRLRHRREIMRREHAEQLNEAKLQFFINISHEIRTPMTLIINPLEKLLSEKKDGEQHQTLLMIYRNAQRILRLINQLMDIRKLDKGQMFLKFRETDMVGFISDVMQPFEYSAGKKRIRFTFTHSLPQLKVWIDLNNFDKVLMNILSNAFKYTPEGGEIHVKLSTGEDASRRDALREYVEIAVTDSGIGLDKNKIDRIFERFYQIDNDLTKSNFGTGIGLHLSRSLVQLHHGIIFAENRDEAPGSRFVIRIPRGSAHLRADELESADGTEPANRLSFPSAFGDLHEEDMGETETPTKNTAKPKAKTRLKVLIAEDDMEIRSYLREELAGEYRVQTCDNGREAYEQLLKDVPDLIISDVMMPEMDGLTLCRKIRQNTNVNHLPVILLTAKSSPEDTLEGMDTGADAYLVKPFSTELLRSTIANLIANRRLLRNKFSGAQQQEERMEKIVMESNDEKLMNRIMKVVNEHLSDPELSVEMLASEVGLSRVHVHRKLKELTNLSARDFIKNIRMQQAAALLSGDKKLTISEVAYATGYTNLSHFSSVFRERYGMSPKEYAARH